MKTTIEDFVERFSANISLPKKMILKTKNRYFLLSANLKSLASKGFFYAGVYLGKSERRMFILSFNLLKMIAEIPEANKVFVDTKAEWLFICGRDIFSQGITKINGSKKKGDYVLVLNQFAECLGYGKISYDLTKEKGKIGIKNIVDIGNFLRRERIQSAS